jgi:hypothetical protein
VSRARLLILVGAVLLLALVGQAAEPDSLRGKPLKSTTGAVLRSLAVPGWGQLYNESYLKAAAFAAAEGSMLVSISFNHDQMMRFKTAHLGEEERFYRNYRNKLIWWLAGTILLSMGDAYVDAHLYGLDISPDLSYARGPTARFTATFHF